MILLRTSGQGAQVSTQCIEYVDKNSFPPALKADRAGSERMAEEQILKKRCQEIKYDTQPSGQDFDHQATKHNYCIVNARIRSQCSTIHSTTGTPGKRASLRFFGD